MEQPPEGQPVCEGENPDGVREGGQGGHVSLPCHILHVQPALLDILSDCCQHAGPQSILILHYIGFFEIVSFLLYKSE